MTGIADKLVRRHPHVFGTTRVRSKEDILRNWERIKQDEKRAAGSGPVVLAGVPPRLPALLRALRLTSKAARVGFDWARAEDVLRKLREELRELAAARKSRGARREKMREELGDVLFVVANLGRKLGLDPEEALRQANRKFERRFAHIERRLAAAGRRPQESSLSEMDRLWDESKQAEKAAPARRRPGRT